jgi:predicted nucleic acid-binding protein
MASKLPLIAVDTNVLLDLAFGNEAVWDCLDALKKRKLVPRLVAMPTVIQE